MTKWLNIAKLADVTNETLVELRSKKATNLDAITTIIQPIAAVTIALKSVSIAQAQEKIETCQESMMVVMGFTATVRPAKVPEY